MDDGKLDLNDLARKHQLSIVPREDPAVRDSRIEIERADADHRRRINLLLHIATFVVVAVALGVCVWGIVSKNATPEAKTIAQTLLPAIVTGFVGYVTGRASK
jgi:hypothetical protein